MLKYFVVFSFALIVAERLTVLVSLWCLKHGIVDRPSQRRLHTGVIPRLGGLAIVLSFLLTTGIISLVVTPDYIAGSLDKAWLLSIAPAMLILILTGVVDDTRGITPGMKMFGQTVAALLLISSGVSIQNISVFILPVWLDIPLTVFFMLLLINAFNLIDGLDGLAAGLAAIALFGLLGLSIISEQPLNALVILVLLGATLGFLRHNFHPASVFLGDTGSMFLGFMIGVIALENSYKSSTVTTLILPLLAFGVPLIDTILAVWRRSVRRLLTGAGGWSQADMDHLHHRLIRLGLSQRSVAYILYFFASFLVVTGLISVLFQSSALGIYLIAFSICSFVVIRHFVHVELWDTGRVLVKGLPFPATSFIATALYPFLDIAIFTLAFIASSLLLIPDVDRSTVRELMLTRGPIWIGVSCIAVTLCRTYSRVWSRARVSEYVYLVGSLFVGTIFTTGFIDLWDSPTQMSNASFPLFYYGLSAAGVTFLRALPRVARDLMAFYGEASSRERNSRARILLVGTSLYALRFLKRNINELPLEATIKIVGFLDQDRNLRRRYIYGYPVLGTYEELDVIVQRERIEEIFITEEVSKAFLRVILSCAELRGLTVRVWTLSENVLVSSGKMVSHEKTRDDNELQYLRLFSS